MSRTSIPIDMLRVLSVARRTGHNRPYPEGPREDITPEWVDRAKAAMRERGWTDADLGRAIGGSRDAVGKMWKQQGSKLVPRVCKALQILPPKVSTDQLPDEEAMELLRLIRALSDEQRQALRVLLKNQFRVQ